MYSAIQTVALAAALLGITGCAAGGDMFGTPEAGYIVNAPARAAAADWTKAEAVTVELSEFAFAPSTLKFRTGAPYRLVLSNIGSRAHTFVSDGFFRAIAAHKLHSSEGDVTSPYLEQITVAPGATKELLFVAVKPGVYELSCTVFLHHAFGMTGTITIV